MISIAAGQGGPVRAPMRFLRWAGFTRNFAWAEAAAIVPAGICKRCRIRRFAPPLAA